MSSAPRRAAVLGSPIAHSLSPALHRAAYRELGLDWSYEAVEVDSAGLAAFLASLDGTWAGLSLTMPLKETVLPLLDDASGLALGVRAANTVILRDGRRSGDNTDVPGMVAALAGAGLPHGAHRGIVIGGGATARSAAAALARLGCRQLVVVARRPDAADDVIAVAASEGVAAGFASWADVAGGRAIDGDVVVSAVPGEAAASLAGALPAGSATLLDAAYHPWPTPLMQAWQGPVATGLDLLLWQAAGQVRLMTGLEPPVDAMRAALPRR